MGRRLVIIITISIIFFSGCTTMAVKAPKDMFISTGDYNSEIITMGIIQEKNRKFAPLYLYDTNKIHEELYEALIDQAEKLNADGVINIRFYKKLSPYTYFSFFIISGVFDFYVDGVAIKEK